MNINNTTINLEQIKERILKQKASGLKMCHHVNDLIAENDLITFNIDVYSLYEEGNHLRVAAFFHLKDKKIYRATALS